MSLKLNIIANIAGQAYVTLIGIVLVPLYVTYMGTEAYGLVGFYAMLQAWFMLLDMGLTPAMSREVARFRGGATGASSLRLLLRSMEGIFACAGVLGALTIIAGSGLIATAWLKVQELPLAEVQGSIMLMAVIIALRWLSGLYRGAINGFERIVWLNAFNVTVATVRFALIIPCFVYVGSTPTVFFAYQLAVAVIEALVLAVQMYRLLPASDTEHPALLSWQPLRNVFKFALSMAFASVVWVLVTQTDRLVLSRMLTLSEYASYSLAVLVAGGILAISGPISGALLPRMTRLNAEGNEAGLIRLYRDATQMVVVAVLPATLVLACFAEPVLRAWTGSNEIAHMAGPALALYALGNGIMSLAAFPYYLQFAKGDLKLHVAGNAVFILIFVPLLIWATTRYGMTGAGYAWLTANLLPFLVWQPIVHHQLIRGRHWDWLLRDVVALVAVPALAACVVRYWLVWPDARLLVAAYVAFLWVVLCMLAAASSPWARGKIAQKWRASLSAGRT